MTAQHKVGDRVVFVGREIEIGTYHPDYAQLMYQIGTVVEAGDPKPFEYVVIFDAAAEDGTYDYPCRADELQAAP